MENVKPEVGMILVSSWGYDQTNVNFYKIVKVSEKSVWIQEVRSVIVEQIGFMSENVMPSMEPVRGGWVKAEDGLGMYYDPEFIEAPQRKVWKGYGVNINSYSGAWVWENKPMYASHYA